MVERNIKDDEDALRMFQDAKKMTAGRPHKNEQEDKYTNNVSRLSEKRNTIQGNAKSYGLEVLHDRHPEMYERIKRKSDAAFLAGEGCANRDVTICFRLLLR